MIRRLELFFRLLSWGVLIVMLSPQVVHSELVHYYSFDTQTAKDAVGSLDGTVNGNPEFVDGESGEAGDFSIRLNQEGAGFNDDHVLFAETEFGEAFSIAAWIRPLGDEQSNQMMAIAANTHGGFAGPDGFKWAINQWDDLDQSIRLETGDTVTGTNDGLVGVIDFGPEWQHLAITFDKEALLYEAFYNGDSVRTGGILDFGDNHPWQIGAFLPTVDEPANAGFIGDIDSVAVFNHILTVDEVSDIWQFGVDVPDVSVPGDFNGDGILTADDIDQLAAAVRVASDDTRFDLDGNSMVDEDDRLTWIEQLKGTYLGDANLDGEFGSTDFVVVFQAGEYEDAIEDNSSWATGDWDGDGDFGTSDFVIAFQSGAYETGPRPVADVPEPLTLIWPAGLLLLLAVRHARSG